MDWFLYYIYRISSNKNHLLLLIWKLLLTLVETEWHLCQSKMNGLSLLMANISLYVNLIIWLKCQYSEIWPFLKLTFTIFNCSLFTFPKKWNTGILISLVTRFRVNLKFYSCLDLKELLAWNRHEIWSLSDYNWTRINNHLVCRWAINHLPKLT